MRFKRLFFAQFLIMGFWANVQATTQYSSSYGLFEMIESEWSEFLEILGIEESQYSDSDADRTKPVSSNERTGVPVETKKGKELEDFSVVTDSVAHLTQHTDSVKIVSTDTKSLNENLNKKRKHSKKKDSSVRAASNTVIAQDKKSVSDGAAKTVTKNQLEKSSTSNVEKSDVPSNNSKSTSNNGVNTTIDPFLKQTADEVFGAMDYVEQELIKRNLIQSSDAKKVTSDNESTPIDIDPNIQSAVDEVFYAMDYVEQELKSRGVIETYTYEQTTESSSSTLNSTSSSNITTQMSDAESQLNPNLKKVLDEILNTLDYIKKELIDTNDRSEDYSRQNNPASLPPDSSVSDSSKSNEKNHRKSDVCVSTERSSHLKFKGVPIDGSLEQFVKGMQNVGFVLKESLQRKATLYGDFAGFKDCHIYVNTLQNKDLVSNILVRFPEREQWKYLSEDYYNLKSMMTEKYGTPTSFVERFNDSYDISSNDESIKLYFVKTDNCRFSSTFTAPQGTIILSIEREAYDCFVTLHYKDKKNSEDVKKHAIDEL